MMHPRRPVRVVAAVVAAAVLALTGACAGPLGGQAVPAAEATPVAAVTSSPALGATDLSPVQPVTLSVAQGTISALTLTSPTGAEVKGTLSADRTSWTLAEPLGYGKTYTVTGTAMGSDGKAVPIQGSYSTVSPAEKMTSKISPGDDAVVGVAAPVIIRFGSEPVDRSLIQQHVTITTTPQVEGAWAWVTHDGDSWPSLDWRPKQYWPAGTTVHVSSDLYGLDLGGGTFGGDTVTSDFTIGRNQVVKADANAHTMVVQQDGVTVATYDASYGSGDVIGDPNRVTRSGTHIVMDKKETTTMSNPAYGYTDVTEHWAVRISDNGEFIHQNQATVADQGVDNVSHGCINLSAQDAQAYFQTAIYGDPVEVTGTSVQLSPADGDIFDWAIPWSEWTALADN
ncbi:MAG TPA: Ig-like domain-containing protein [Nakamurella multipartita]|mgnify:FL=1|nr:Ig-like domain-containing protein [Nakamurella multipartita]